MSQEIVLKSRQQNTVTVLKMKKLRTNIRIMVLISWEGDSDG